MESLFSEYVCNRWLDSFDILLDFDTLFPTSGKTITVHSNLPQLRYMDAEDCFITTWR